MTTVTLSRPAPGAEIVRLKNNQGCDELNVEGKSYRPDARRAFHVPRRHVTPELLTVGGFYIEPHPTLAESLQDIADHVERMKPGATRDALTAALAGLFEDTE